MNETGYLLLGLTALIGALAGVVMFAVLRVAAAAKEARRGMRQDGAETALLASALEEAVAKLRRQEQASHARARASERLSEQIIASLASGLMVVDLDGRVRVLNPAAARLLDLATRDDAPSCRELLAPDALPLASVIEECLASRRPIVRRALEMRASGSSGRGPSHLGVTVSPIFDDRGAAQGVICLFSDLTTVFDLEEQLRLKDSLARLGELTAGLAHEFRNGLATIHGYARLLDPTKLAAAHSAYVLEIRRETEALGQVVDKFLSFARPAHLTLADLDLRAVATRAADEILADVTGKGGEVHVQGTFDMVRGDEILLRQALGNLCRNALEACMLAGTVPRIVLEGSVDRAHGIARVAVDDNGPGIDPAARDRIFQPFFTTRAQGTGLGLALVQKIVVTHNGRVTAGRSPAGGARIQITLPLAESPSPFPLPRHGGEGQ